jgi:hypothetical protein
MPKKTPAKKKTLRKLSTKEKAEIFYYMDWEGGPSAVVYHGGIFSMVKGTELEAPFRAIQEALEIIDRANLEQAAIEVGEGLND